ncbi:MAG: tRNA-dihydrouridine synthase [Candidatus Magasanikbacteria bacterium]|nr:tRNA-dihydrouridine synthase [Candidatus Magasanikbacteria bacterium]
MLTTVRVILRFTQNDNFMISGFWKNLPKPIFGLAPMANVTDAAFRRIIAKYGKPDVMWTEFVSCDGLQSPGQKELLVDFMYSEPERPIVAQIFGSKPDNFYKTALLIQELGFDGIDINMGCPDRNVEKQCAGAAMMKNPKLAQECVAATKRGAGKLPISIKTRLGFNKNELDTWLPTLLETDVSAITIHARTRKEMSQVPARWEEIARAVAIRDKFDNSSNKTLIIGNGDVIDIADAKQKIVATGCDGVMIGRGIFGNPWLFRNCHSEAQTIPRLGGVGVGETLRGQHSPASPTPGREAFPAQAGNWPSPATEVDIAEKLRVMVEHTKLFEKLLGDKKNFHIMKKHYKAYVNGFAGAKELRIKLMTEAEDASAVEKIVEKFIQITNSPAAPLPLA